MLTTLLLTATAQAADLPLGDLGTWPLPDAWAVQTTTGSAPEALGAVLGGPQQGTATVLVLGASNTLSPAGLVHQATGMDASVELTLEQHGSLWWWHGSGPAGSAWSTERGTTTVVVSSAASDVGDLLDGLVLNCPGLDIDETWMSFTLPAGVPWLHQYASPWSWTRGEGFASVDLVFERPSLGEPPPPPAGAMAELAGSLPEGWELIEGQVGADKVSALVGGQALGQGMIAPPGSHIKAHIVVLRYRDGMAQVELRAEGPDADLVAANDLSPLASTVSLKRHFDGGYDARSIPWHATTAQLATDAQNLADFLSASSDLVTGLTGSGDEAQALLQPQDNGLTGLQQAGIQAIESYQAGVAPTATESTTAVAMGYVPMVQQSFEGYFSPGNTETSSTRGVGASISQGNRVFHQRGTLGANWILAWPQDGFNDTSAASAGLDAAPHTAFSIKLDGAFLLDPTTHFLPHRMGNFGEWELDIGLAAPIAFQFQNVQPTGGSEEKLANISFGIAPAAGAHLRLFGGALTIWGQGWWKPAQLGIVETLMDSSRRTQVEDDLAAGKLPNPGAMLAESGISGLMAEATSVATFKGSRGGWLGASVGLPFTVGPGTRHANIPRSAGPLAPLQLRVGRAGYRSTLGLGAAAFYDESNWRMLSPDSGDGAFAMRRVGLIVGLGTVSTALPSFGSGDR